MKAKVSIIVAIDEKQGIGKNNDLLFKISEDFKRMKALTTGHAIIMGRRTFESIGRVLPNRTNIIVTRDPNFQFAGTVVCSSLEEALEKAKKLESTSLRGGTTKQSTTGSENKRDRHATFAMTKKDEEVFVFGGGQIFKEAIEKGLVDRLYLTIVTGDYGADTFFPDYKQFGFTKIIEEEKRESDGYTYSFVTLEK